MADWWNGLEVINQIFYAAAGFFSIFFIWQLIAAFLGLGADHGDMDLSHDITDAGAGSTYDQFEHGAHIDASATEVSFQIISIRSLITFFTLFTWGTALYLNQGRSIYISIGYSFIWGLAGMFSVALIFFLMRKLTETGTINLNTAIGGTGSVYLNIPKGGVGEIRITVSGVVSYVKARASGGRELMAGTPVRVTRKIDQTTVEVEPIE